MGVKTKVKWYDCVLDYGWGKDSKGDANHEEEGKKTETFTSASIGDAKESAIFFLKHRAGELMITKKFLLNAGMKSNCFTHAFLEVKENGGRGKERLFLLNRDCRNFGKVSFSGSLFKRKKHWK